MFDALTDTGWWSCRVRELREGEVWKKNKIGSLQEQITSNEMRRGSSQITELLLAQEKSKYM